MDPVLNLAMDSPKNLTMHTAFNIGNLQVKNRIVASSMFEYGAKNGMITPQIKNHYTALSEGGAGLIITGMHAVSASGSIAPLMVNTEYSNYVKDLASVVTNTHDNDARLIVQLQHCGEKTWKDADHDKFAVCDIFSSQHSALSDAPPLDPTYHQATREELRKVTADYAASALRCKKAGADGIQIHAAHGYLINTFLSPSTNHRTDEYGGSYENRARLLLEICTAIRETVGDDFIIGVKFPFSDLREDSIKPSDSLAVCKMLEAHRVDFIEITSGMLMDRSKASFTPRITLENQAPFLMFAAKVADTVAIPVISVCGYRTPEVIEKTLNKTNIAAISLGRPLVREPNLPYKWKTEQAPATCISCNQCCNSAERGILTCFAR